MWYSIWVFFTVFFMNQRFCFALNKDLSFNLVSLLKRDQSPIFFTKLIRKPPRWPGVRWPSRGWPSNPFYATYTTYKKFIELFFTKQRIYRLSFQSHGRNIKVLLLQKITLIKKCIKGINEHLLNQLIPLISTHIFLLSSSGNTVMLLRILDTKK